MTKNELVKDMQKFAGCSFMTRGMLTKYMGYKDNHTVGRYLYGLPAVDGKLYFVGDIADVLIARGK